jgi:hypothetical protein
MGFLTEMFSRPRPQDMGRTRVHAAAVAFCDQHRPVPPPRPADFPRLPRRFRSA